MAEVITEVKSVPLDDKTVDMATYIKARENGNTATVDLPVEQTPEEAEETPGAQAESGSEQGTEHHESEEGKSQAESDAKDWTPAQQAAFDKRVKRELKKLNEEFERKSAELKPAATEKEQAKETPAKETEDPEPELSEYPTREEIKKHAEWTRRQAARDLAAIRAQEMQQAKMNEVLSDAVKTYPDWNEVVAKVDRNVLKPAAQQIVGSVANARDVIYHLASQLDTDEKRTAFSAMSEADQINEVVQLSASLLPSGSKEAPKDKKPAPPEPITPVGGGSAKSSTPLEKMSQVEYNKAREAGRTR